MASFPAAAPLDQIADALAADGYVIVERAAPELAEQAFEDLQGSIDAAPVGHTPFLGERTKRLGSLLRRSSAAQDLAVHPIVLGLADRILQPHCARYQLNYSGIMHLLPGATPQELHRDGDLYPFRHPSPPTLMPTMWALSDFTVENGATQIVPESHRWAEERDPFPDEIISAVMPAGSALVYLSGTIHGAGRNVSSATRTGLALQYSLGWLRQEENQYLANPPEIARTFPDRLQRLIGYDYGAPYLGFVDGDTPQRVLLGPTEGPGHRTTPEVDRAAQQMTRHRWGDVAALAAPVREGVPIHASKGPIAAADSAATD
jgi:ectoine hydroxylase-related dioxygenase (phytanoyl-CoA dioxygenase family)